MSVAPDEIRSIVNHQPTPYGSHRVIKRFSGTSGNGRALHCRGQIRGEDNAGIVVVGHPCRDLRGWRGLFPGSRDTLGIELTERERPELENRPGFFLLFRAFNRHPEVAAHLARPSKDGGRALVAHPSRLGMKDAEHLRMTAVPAPPLQKAVSPRLAGCYFFPLWF